MSSSEYSDSDTEMESTGSSSTENSSDSDSSSKEESSSDDEDFQLSSLLPDNFKEKESKMEFSSWALTKLRAFLLANPIGKDERKALTVIVLVFCCK